MLETGIFQLLSATPAVTALISNRVFYVKLPVKETKLPAVVMNVIHSRSVWSARGPSGLRFTFIQLDTFATNFHDACNVARELRKALANFTGELPDGTRVQGSIVISEMDLPFEPGTSGYVFRRVLEIEFQHEE